MGIIDQSDSPVRRLRGHRQLKAQSFATASAIITKNQGDRDFGLAGWDTDFHEVRPVASYETSTRSAFTTGVDFSVGVFPAEHRLSQQPGELTLADAIRSGQNVSMGQPAAFERPREQFSLFLMAFE